MSVRAGKLDTGGRGPPSATTHLNLTAQSGRTEPGPIQSADSRDHARAIAAELAKTYRPTHPRRRSVFRHGEDTLFVLLEGMSSQFHLRITVVQLVADLDADGKPFEG
ncbi:hypothetical protein [Amycolatopsis sp. DG1A-15b]|uniref:hypothetical protein n=1 Tax=Amycolatopsis sp. DG1A-15b TaxID=3052846 RepID=UPI00255B9116|nr:hypothetical protein [Amycolatopsis sp. DG1A-15b]WIX86544.1 hypothetical protein QRY02_35965 [Amycolatopsis sp. DG1A-15b]